MKLLLIHQAFAALDEPGGTRHFELSHYLAQNGNDVIIITSPISYLTGKDQSHLGKEIIRVGRGSITIYRVRTYRAFHRSFFHRTISFITFMVTSFWEALTVSNVDVVWGTSPPIFQTVTAWLIARLKRVPFLLEVRDLWPAFAIQVGVLKNPILIRLSEWLERFLLKRADCVVVNSPGFISHVKERGAKWVECIPNGADPALFDRTDLAENQRSRFGLEEKFVVLYAGAHGLSNDLGTVLLAANQLKAYPDICIVFVGDGKEKPALIQQSVKMGLSNVIFLDAVKKREMPAILAMADACLAILKPIPLYGTVYPNKVFDYMAAGKPIILAMEGVIRQLVEQAQAGLVVTPGDGDAIAQAILTLKNQPALAQAMGQNGRKLIENEFNRQKLAEQFLLVFTKVRLSNRQRDAEQTSRI
ncbi:MAG: glycosyltransferase family 4 protein [Anaerolineales bacterium]